MVEKLLLAFAGLGWVAPGRETHPFPRSLLDFRPGCFSL